jgi:hypothetical protein
MCHSDRNEYVENGALEVIRKDKLLFKKPGESRGGREQVTN